MSYSESVQINISLQANPVSEAGFSIPVFLGKGRWFPEKVRAYNSLAEVGEDIPTSANEYLAATTYFAQTNEASPLKIGRYETTVVVAPSAGVVETNVVTLTVTVNDGDSVVASHTVGPAEDAEDILTALAADINGDAPVAAHVTATVVGTGVTATMTIVPVGAGDLFHLKALSLVDVSWTSTQTGADAFDDLLSEDEDFFFLVPEDQSQAFVTSLAPVVQAADKMMAISSKEQDTLTAYDENTSTDTFALLRNTGYQNVFGYFSHQSDSAFPALGAIGERNVTQPGTTAWGHKKVQGVENSRNPQTGNVLKSTEKGYVNDRSANFFHKFGNQNGVTYKQALTFSGDRISNVRSALFLSARIAEAYQNLILNSGKIPFTSKGINKLRNTCQNVLGQYVETDASNNILQSNNPYELTFPGAETFTAQQKASGVYTASFKAYLSGQIDTVVINGTLTFEDIA